MSILYEDAEKEILMEKYIACGAPIWGKRHIAEGPEGYCILARGHLGEHQLPQTPLPSKPIIDDDYHWTPCDDFRFTAVDDDEELSWQ